MSAFQKVKQEKNIGKLSTLNSSSMMAA